MSMSYLIIDITNLEIIINPNSYFSQKSIEEGFFTRLILEIIPIKWYIYIINPDCLWIIRVKDCLNLGGLYECATYIKTID